MSYQTYMKITTSHTVQTLGYKGLRFLLVSNAKGRKKDTWESTDITGVKGHQTGNQGGLCTSRKKIVLFAVWPELVGL